MGWGAQGRGVKGGFERGYRRVGEALQRGLKGARKEGTEYKGASGGHKKGG